MADYRVSFVIINTDIDPSELLDRIQEIAEEIAEEGGGEVDGNEAAVETLD